MVTAAMKLKDTPWKESYDHPRQHIKKQGHYFANKGLSSQGYGFSNSHVWMWELDYKENWAPKNWCFWTMVLEKTLKSPLDSKDIRPVHPKENWTHFKVRLVKALVFPVVMYGYERWKLTPKNWCFWTAVLEKTLESPLDSKDIQPVHPKENQSWIFIGRTDA